MNAYIASFMLLLFNAVGFAVPVSAAAEEHMIPQSGSATPLADISAEGQAAAIGSATAVLVDHSFAAMAAMPVSVRPEPDTVPSRNPAWPVATMGAETGDKLEHEEGAP